MIIDTTDKYLLYVKRELRHIKNDKLRELQYEAIKRAFYDGIKFANGKLIINLEDKGN